MTKLSEKIKQTISSENDYPQFSKMITTRFQTKQPESINAPAFVYKNTDGEGYSNTTKSITGIFIGEAMRFTVFDSKKKKSISTTPFFSYKDNILVFQDGEKIKMNANDAKEYLNKIGITKVRRLYYVYTTNNNLIEIDTNIGLSITDEFRLGKDNMCTNYIIFTPSVFDFNDSDYSNKEKNMLGALAKKNPPSYAKMTLGNPIKEEQEDDAIRIIDEFIKFKKFITSNSIDNLEVNQTNQHQQVKDTTNNFPNNSELLDTTDDLPF